MLTQAKKNAEGSRAAHQAVAPSPMQEGVASRAPIAGLPLPPDTTNPPCGEHGHMCLDSFGKYQPSWAAVYIHKTPEVPEAQAFFDDKADTILVPTGRWWDVPATVVRTLQDTRSPTITRESKSGHDLSSAMADPNRGTVPRWQYSVIPSA